MWCEIGSWPSVVAAAVTDKAQTLHPLQTRRARRTALAVGLALTVAACSSIDSMFEGDDPPPTARTTAPAAGGDKDYPKLSTVPARPERPTPPPQQGLAADRESARYADNQGQPVNEAANAVVGQSLGASTRPAAAPSTAAVAPAPTAPVAAPAGRVQQAPVTPVQQAQPQQAPQPAQPAAPPAQASAPVQQAPVQQAPVQQAPVQQAPVAAAPTAAPVASTLPPPPAPSQQALILPPTTRPAVGAVVAGRSPSAAPASPVYYGNAIQVAVVQFGRASSGLSSDDLRVLRDVAEIQKKQGGVIRIVGHASQDASSADVERLEQANYAVSLARANAIAGQLVRFGVPRGSVAVEGVSDRQPEFDPVTAVAVASNRRAEIYLAF